MDDARQAGSPTDDRVGLCRRCAHAACQRNARGNAFWRCRASERDARLLRYPPLPVRECHAFEAGEPEGADA